MTQVYVISAIVLCACVSVLESAPMSRDVFEEDVDKRGGVASSARGNGFHQSLYEGKRGGVARDLTGNGFRQSLYGGKRGGVSRDLAGNGFHQSLYDGKRGGVSRSLTGNSFHQSLYPMVSGKRGMPPTALRKREPQDVVKEAGGVERRDYLDFLSTSWGGGWLDDDDDPWGGYNDPWDSDGYGYYGGWDDDWPRKRNSEQPKAAPQHAQRSLGKDIGERDYLTTILGMGSTHSQGPSHSQSSNFGHSLHNTYNTYGSSTYYDDDDDFYDDDWYQPCWYYYDEDGYYYIYCDYYDYSGQEHKKRHVADASDNSENQKAVKSPGSAQAGKETSDTDKRDYWYNYPYYYYYGSNDLTAYYNHRRDTEDVTGRSRRNIEEVAAPDGRKRVSRDYFGSVIGGGQGGGGNHFQFNHQQANQYQYNDYNDNDDDSDWFIDDDGNFYYYDDDYYDEYYQSELKRSKSSASRRRAPTLNKKGVDSSQRTKTANKERKAPTVRNHQAKQTARKSPTKSVDGSGLLAALKRNLQAERLYDDVMKE